MASGISGVGGGSGFARLDLCSDFVLRGEGNNVPVKNDLLNSCSFFFFMCLVPERCALGYAHASIKFKRGLFRRSFWCYILP